MGLFNTILLGAGSPPSIAINTLPPENNEVGVVLTKSPQGPYSGSSPCNGPLKNLTIVTPHPPPPLAKNLCYEALSKFKLRRLMAHAQQQHNIQTELSNT